MNIPMQLSVQEKLEILSDAAKYDVACTSSGVDKNGDANGIGNCKASGICHTFSADGRCVSLLKILYTNECVFNCSYCINNCNNDVPRASFTPEEICSLTIEFYRRNYIEGLFLSSGILINPNYTMDLIYQTLFLLRTKYAFHGYIHVKAIPGADPALIQKTGYLADRMSINLELPTAEGLRTLAPYKSRNTILRPMRQIQQGIHNNTLLLSDSTYKNALPLSVRENKSFVPAGQSTQMIIGATPENDFQIMSVAENLYHKFDLKRVFYSAFINVTNNSNLPTTIEGPPLLREHRLYQADWLLRYYHFKVQDLLTEEKPNFNIYLDPKCDWALRNLSVFPIEISTASYTDLLKIPGVGVKSAQRIIKARKSCTLTFTDLKKIGVVLKRALYFITCSGKMMYPTKMDENYICRNLLHDTSQIPRELKEIPYKQISLFDCENRISIS